MNILKAILSKLPYAMSLCVGLIALSSCGNEDTPMPPTPFPPEQYPLGEELIEVPSEGGTITAEPLDDENVDFAALGYIATYPFLDSVPYAEYDLSNGSVGGVSIADYYGVYSVLDYNASIGIDGYVNSDEVEYEYEWVKVKCFKPENSLHTRVEINAAPNDGNEERYMLLYFMEPSRGLIWVHQQAK